LQVTAARKTFGSPQARPDSPAKDVIKCRSFKGKREAEFTVQQSHDLDTSAGADRDPFD
jgi:hypothetical protein